MYKLLSLFVAGTTALSLAAAELQNPSFKIEKGAIQSWKNHNNSKVSSENGVLSVIATNSKMQDGIFQQKKITPSDKTYIFSIDVDAPVAGAAYLQIKFYSKGKELARYDSMRAKAGKSRINVAAFNEQAEYMELAVRITQAGAGKLFKFSNPVLSLGEKGILIGNWMQASKSFTPENITTHSFDIKITGEAVSHASMANIRQVLPNRNYVFEADYESEMPGMAYLEVKLFKNGKNVSRKQVLCKESKGKLVIKFNTGDCKTAHLQCRVPSVKKFVGKKATFSNFKFYEAE